MLYREEREFTIRLRAVAEFPDDYEGEDDGYEWAKRFDQALRPKLVSAIFDILAKEQGWRITPTSRGTSRDDEVEVRLERVEPKATPR